MWLSLSKFTGLALVAVAAFLLWCIIRKGAEPFPAAILFGLWCHHIGGIDTKWSLYVDEIRRSNTN